MIALNGIQVQRGGRTIINGLSTSLAAGQIHVIIGPNGTGKTTLLGALFGELPLATGTIRCGERELTAGKPRGKTLQQWRDGIAYLPQDSTADIGLTVLEVVVLGRLGRLSLHIYDETLDAAMQRLEQAGIGHLAERDIASLSGGQRQMVLFAQVMMREPEVMLLDEPVSALDLKHQLALLNLVRRETRARNWVTVIVLHDLNLACQYADNLLVVAGGQLQAAGRPREVINAQLIGDTYGVEVEILHDRAGNPVVQPLGISAQGDA
ncbi:ATP-binding cassette domain-containing protein [Erwinia sp. E602]|uniref:ABC transporter ATP-binding protein n=1 Tax=Erwinia sp. E602 TaxID=2675378 RepID=UPI001BA5C1D3|nr:ABC transporter ATP-binding protein [Erwinia sp. E602]QUG74378.1 ATP-binding cassette domain-containing protein [Erwinia sp. E602]